MNSHLQGNQNLLLQATDNAEHAADAPPNKSEIDPNEYAEIPYIPAIHGASSDALEVDSLASLLHSSAAAQSSPAAATTNEASPVELTTRLGTTLTDCTAKKSCSLALAAGSSIFTAAALAIPVLFGKKKRKRRNAEPEFIYLPRESIFDIIRNYEKFISNNDDYLPSNPFTDFSGLFNVSEVSDDWKNHQQTANIISKRVGEIDSVDSSNTALFFNPGNQNSFKNALQDDWRDKTDISSVSIRSNQFQISDSQDTDSYILKSENFPTQENRNEQLTDNLKSEKADTFTKGFHEDLQLAMQNDETEHQQQTEERQHSNLPIEVQGTESRKKMKVP